MLDDDEVLDEGQSAVPLVGERIDHGAVSRFGLNSNISQHMIQLLIEIGHLDRYCSWIHRPEKM